MGIFQPAMLVYQSVFQGYEIIPTYWGMPKKSPGSRKGKFIHHSSLFYWLRPLRTFTISLPAMFAFKNSHAKPIKINDKEKRPAKRSEFGPSLSAGPFRQVLFFFCDDKFLDEEMLHIFFDLGNFWGKTG